MKSRWLRWVVFGIIAVMSLTVWSVSSVRGQGTITIRIIDAYTRDTPVISKIIAEYERLHPNVKIERNTLAYEKAMEAINIALSAGKGADIVMDSNGEVQMGPLVRNGRLLPLDTYAKKYGWEKDLLSPGLWARNKYTQDGKTFGEGSIYGLSYGGEIVGVYYNRDIFRKLQVSLPQDFDDLQRIAAKIKAAGITPFGLGCRGAVYACQQYWGAIEQMLVSRDTNRAYLDDIIMKWSSERSWKTKWNTEAAGLIQEWARKGYLTDGFLALGYDDSLGLFASGKAAMYITGNWAIPSISKSKSPIGFFLMPPFKKGQGLPLQTGGVRTPIGINKASQHPDEAADYLNFFIASDFAVKLFEAEGQLVAKVPMDLSHQKPTSLGYDMAKAWNTANKQNIVGHYLDWATPTFYNTFGDAVSNLMALKSTPDQFLEKLEADYLKWQQNKPK